MDDAKLARLLAGRDEPSTLEKEAVLERVLERTAPRRPAYVPTLFAALTLSAAGVALFVMSRPAPVEFQARGAASTDVASVQLLCVDTGAIGRCPARGTIAIDVRVHGPDAYFAAFARRDDAIVWFLPEERGTSALVKGGDIPALLSKGVRFPEHAAVGDYQVFTVFSETPLTRTDVKSKLGDDLRGSPGVHVLRQRFVLEPNP